MGGTGASAGGMGGMAGMGGGATVACSRAASCQACKDCVYEQLPGTQQDCAIYDGCAYTCGADPNCQADCMSTFPEGYDIQIELLASCDRLCPGVPTCI